MGLLWWWSKKEEPLPNSKSKSSSQSNSDANSGLKGAMEVRRPADATVFEFGSSYEVTLAGYCPVSDELEPCRWEILPSGGNAPQFRVVF